MFPIPSRWNRISSWNIIHADFSAITFSRRQDAFSCRFLYGRCPCWKMEAKLRFEAAALLLFLKSMVFTVFLLTPTIHTAAEVTWIATPFPGECDEIDSTRPGEPGDYILYRCRGIQKIPNWVIFHEGYRQSIGFGKIKHFSVTEADINRKLNWPLVWGGHTISGEFVPEVVMGRFTFPGDEPRHEYLLVVRLLDNGTSCVVGVVGPEKNQNDKAREIAVAAVKKWKCEAEPQLLAE